MKYIYAALLASAFAMPALAGDAFSTGDSHGPRRPSGQTEPDQSYGPPHRAREGKSGAKVPWYLEPWSYEAQSPKGWTDDRPHELAEQIARNKAYQLRAIQQLGEDGGCNADFIPYGYAVDCSAFLVNNAPFGGADNRQMGSSGD